MKIEEVIRKLEYYGTTYAIGDNLGREIQGTEEIMFKSVELIKQQQAEINHFKDLAKTNIDAYFSAKNELEQLKAQQPVKCCECKFYNYHYKNGVSCDLCNKELLQADDYCSYGMRKESECK